jgi:N-acetylated-alpha-linked acidic dipeptidase
MFSSSLFKASYKDPVEWHAPGYYTGYSVKTLPGIRESIEQRNFQQAETEIKRAAASINKLAGYLSEL